MAANLRRVLLAGGDTNYPPFSEIDMKTSFLAGTALAGILAGTSAYAADVRVPLKAPIVAPQFSWTGCYVGGNVGIGAGHAEWTDIVPDGNIDNDLIARTARTAHTDMSGMVAGGQVGCDYQFNGSWVIGIAGSLNASDVTGTNMDQFNQTWTLRDKIDWYGSVTGRIGAAINTALIYARGAYAFAHNNFEIENSGVTLGTPSNTRTGWTLGVGVEWAFAPCWSAFVEGNYYRFGNNTETFANNLNFVMQPPLINVQPIAFETLTVGLNYRFGSQGILARY
jgi:outer membrane immunogenic protein